MGNVNDFINQLIAMFGNLETLISAASGAAIAAIVLYQKIKKMLAEKSLEAIISPIAAEAENKPMQVLNSIVNKPLAMDSTAQAVSQTAINSNDGKQLIVAAAAYETTKATKPKILRKLGIKSVNDMMPFVSLIYQGIVKPIIKRH
jgi:hypothetical protein